MATKFHTETTYNHTPFDLVYANASDRELGQNESQSRLITADMADPPRFALQLDDYSVWMLVGTSPIQWVAIGGQLPAITSDVTYYIDGTSGDDSNDGSQANPYQTFDRAFANITNRKITNGATVRFRVASAGTYTSFPKYVDLEIDEDSKLVLDASGLTPTAVAGPFTVASVTPVGDVTPDFVSLATDLGVTAPGWSVDEFYTETLKVLTGNYAGYHFAIKKNGTDYIRVTADFFGFAPGDTFEIVREPVIVDVNHFVRFTNRNIDAVPRTDPGVPLNIAAIRFDGNDSTYGSALEIHQMDCSFSFVSVIGHVVGVECCRLYDSFVNYIPVDAGTFDGGAGLEDYFQMTFAVWPQGGATPTGSNRTIYLKDSYVTTITTPGLFYVVGTENAVTFCHADGTESQLDASCVVWGLFVQQVVNDWVFYNPNGVLYVTSAWIEKADSVISSRVGGISNLSWLKGNAVAAPYAAELLSGATIRLQTDDITITGSTGDAIFLIESAGVAWPTIGSPVRLPPTQDDGSRLLRG